MRFLFVVHKNEEKAEQNSVLFHRLTLKERGLRPNGYFPLMRQPLCVFWLKTSHRWKLGSNFDDLCILRIIWMIDYLLQNTKNCWQIQAKSIYWNHKKDVSKLTQQTKPHDMADRGVFFCPVLRVRLLFRLVAFLSVSVQPFAEIVASQSCSDGNHKGYK